jgi:hypothetical protein
MSIWQLKATNSAYFQQYIWFGYFMYAVGQYLYFKAIFLSCCDLNDEV